MSYIYDICLSFADEDREYAEKSGNELTNCGMNVFYDKYEQSGLWGGDLYTYLSYIYSQKSRYCIMFISEHYANRLWTNHEARIAQERAFMENREYILPVCFDKTRIPGNHRGVDYIDANKVTPTELAEIFLAKTGRTA